jgi:hypothetical protein
MPPFRYRDDDSSSGIILGAIVGAVAGFAAGIYMAQNAGTGERTKLKDKHTDAEPIHERIRHAHGASDDVDDEFDDDIEDDEFEEVDEEELDSEDYDVTLEERVLEAFRNDPILSTRAVDIGSLRVGVIELAGVVDTAQEAQHAVTIARGVPGVESVVNRIVTGANEPHYHEASRSHRRHASADVERSVSDSRVVRGDMAANPKSPADVRGDQPRGDEPRFDGDEAR